MPKRLDTYGDRTVRAPATLLGEKRGTVIMTGVTGFVNPRFGAAQAGVSDLKPSNKKTAPIKKAVFYQECSHSRQGGRGAC